MFLALHWFWPSFLNVNEWLTRSDEIYIQNGRLLKFIKYLEHSQKRKQCSNDMKCYRQITAVAPSLSLSTNCWLTRSDERLQLASLDNSKDGSKIFDKSLPQHHWIILIEGIKKNFVVIGAWWTCYIIGAKKDDQSSMTSKRCNGAIVYLYICICICIFVFV